MHALFKCIIILLLQSYNNEIQNINWRVIFGRIFFIVGMIAMLHMHYNNIIITTSQCHGCMSMHMIGYWRELMITHRVSHVSLGHLPELAEPIMAAMHDVDPRSHQLLKFACSKLKFPSL